MAFLMEPSPDAHDGPADPTAIARRWIAAFNARDADALVALADPEIQFRPTVVVGRQQDYRGHAGLREWIADVVAGGAPQDVRVAEVRASPGGGALALGDIVIAGESVSPFALLLNLRRGRVLTGRAYLSDAEILQQLGLVAG